MRLTTSMLSKPIFTYLNRSNTIEDFFLKIFTLILIPS